jgi:hypothetical protein
MTATLLHTCRISLLTTLLAAISPQAGLAAGIVGMSRWGDGNLFVFQLSSTPLASSRGE